MSETWGFSAATAACEVCGWTFATPEERLPLRCPHCSSGQLTAAVGEEAQERRAHAPELLAPNTVGKEQLLRGAEAFVKSVRLPPADLTAHNLSTRLKRVYFPVWLVDAEVQATWQAQVGFNYDVVSHKEQFADGGGWSTRQLKEQRIRWEPRMGQLKRAYENVQAPALESHNAFVRALGPYNTQAAQPYAPELAQDAFIGLPDRSTRDAWGAAVEAMKRQAGEECRLAAQGDHVREFTWQPEFPGQHWSLLLLPVYFSYYLDDDQRVQRVYVHGQNGRFNGWRRASMKRAQQTALFILGAALALFVLGLILTAAGAVAPPLLAVGGLTLFAAICLGMGVLIPILVAWQFNRGQKRAGGNGATG
ncbi:MAG: hydrogenase maturation nickel metallochaperone HypA [Chloroflexi bacterium]|nr:hydrogenase maturation nickel metallochaperone HypA [Chloroflexota bacterium]